METERFNGRANAEDQGAVALDLDLAKALERVSLLVVWAWATSPSPGRSCWCFAGILNTRGGCSLKDVRRSRSRPSRLSCQGRSGVACFDALFVAHDSSQSTNCMFATARLRNTKPVMPCQHTLRYRWKMLPNC